MRLDAIATRKYIRNECADFNMGAMFHEEGDIQTPFTDGNTIHLFEPNGAWDDDRFLRWEYECQHEISHEAPENITPHWKTLMMDKELSAQSLLGSVFNLMIDHIHEHTRIGKYPGRDNVLLQGRYQFLRENEIIEKADEPASSPESRLIKLLFIVDTIHRSRWNPLLVGLGEGVAKLLPTKEAEELDKLLAVDVNIDQGETTADGYAYALEYVDAVDDLEKRKEEAKSAGAGESGGEGEEIDGYFCNAHYNKPKDKGSSHGCGQHISYSKKDMEGGYTFTPKDYKERHLKGESKNPRVFLAIQKAGVNSMLSGKVRRLLTAMQKSVWIHGTKRGRISGKNLWKGARPSYEQAVYRKTAPKLELNTAVSILCDFSGSMSGDKVVQAAVSGIQLNDAISKIRVPVDLLAFTESRKGPVHMVVKGFGEINVDSEELAVRYSAASEDMEQNSDGESIVWAYERLRRRKEERKVLIVLSDGSPAAFNGDYGTEVKYTRDVIKKIESTTVEIYGVGIQDRNVEKFYKDHCVINNVNELEEKLLEIVKTKVISR